MLKNGVCSLYCFFQQIRFCPSGSQTYVSSSLTEYAPEQGLTSYLFRREARTDSADIKHGGSEHERGDIGGVNAPNSPF